MDTAIVESHHGVTLVGGGPVSQAALSLALTYAPRLVAADGGADRALRLGHLPQAVIGDLDSISDVAKRQLKDRLHLVSEQETTDFEKALRRIRAPFVLGLGFAGARIDHGLAVLNCLVRHTDRHCLILTGQDVVFAAPPRLDLTLPVGSRVSLYPLAPMRGQSDGLRWPIDAVRFAPDGMIGTSNQVAARRVRLTFDTAAMLVILPRARLGAVLDALVPPTPAGLG